MPFSAGDKLGPYTILALAGKGGMGEVYRAHDDRLRRDVAIKVSNDQFTERFTREARAVAALNHTNIAHLYDIGPNYLVMEYVEGADLKGPLEFDDALPIIQQLIDGIEAAHEKHIIHRDLKPANIKITPEGVVKILDFGLAKAMETPADSDPENSPTLTLGATVAGAILGTAAYMSPEQARGKAADKRSDVWSFGVIVYEMLTGKRLFQGESVADILGGVLNKEPDVSVAPARVRKLLLWCLEKDRKQRLSSISDARRLLLPSETADAAAPAPPAPKGRTWLPWAVAGIVALALIPGNVRQYLHAPPPLPVLSTTLLPPDEAGYDFSYAIPILSPDGTRIVFGARTKAGRSQLWLRRLDSQTAQPLPGTEGASRPFWSPDSRWVAFGQAGKLKKIDTQGGQSIPIADLPPASVGRAFGGGTWSSQGVILIASGGPGRMAVVAASGGTVVEKAELRGRAPWFLPDGRHFLYTPGGQTGDMPVRVASLDEPDKPGKVVAQASSTVAYSQGHLLFLRGNALTAQPFDLDRLETTGEAMPLAEGVASFSHPVRIAGFTASPEGLLTYITGSGESYQLLWKDREGKVLGNLGEQVPLIGSFNLSPDRKSVAAQVVTSSTASTDLWIFDAARGLRTKFTFGIRAREPVWSPDGKTVYFSADSGKGIHLYRKSANGTGREELFLEDGEIQSASSVSPDGRLLMYSRNDPKTKTQADIWIVPVNPEASGAKPKPRAFLQTPFIENRGRFSPDGQSVVYESNESGQNEIYVVPFPGPGGKRQVSSGGGVKARWRSDGKEIFYQTEDGQLMAAEVIAGSAARNGTPEIGKIQKLFDGVLVPRGHLYDVSADGQRFLVADEDAIAARPLTLLQNWTGLVKQ